MYTFTEYQLTPWEVLSLRLRNSDWKWLHDKIRYLSTMTKDCMRIMKSCSHVVMKLQKIPSFISSFIDLSINLQYITKLSATMWQRIRCLSRVKMPTHTSTHKHYLAQQAPLSPVSNEKIRPGTTGFLLTRAKDSSVCRNTAEALMRCCPKRRADISHWLTGLEEAQKQQVVNNIRLSKDSVHRTHPQTAGSPHWRTLLTFFIWLGWR